MRRRTAFIAAIAAIAITLSGCGSAETASPAYSSYEEGDSGYDLSGVTGTYTLTVQTHEPEYTAPGEFLSMWADSIEEASGGHIEMDVNYGAKLGGAKDTLSMVGNDVADIGWGTQCSYSGTFPVTEVFSLPGLGIGSAQEGSEALWEFWDTTDYLSAEYEGYHVLLLHTGCGTTLAFPGDRAESMDALSGKTICAVTGVQSSFIRKAGAVPTEVSDKALADDFSDNTIYGAVKAWDMFDILDLDPAAYLDEDLGRYTYFLLMNQESYDSLPAALQEIIDDKSAEALAYTAAWDEAEEEAKASAGNKVYQFDSSGKERLGEISGQAAQDWIQSMDEAGYDGQGIYDAATSCIRAAGTQETP